MEILTNRQQLHGWTRGVHQQGDWLGFVPTMGALHAGHLSLVKAAQQQCGRVIASIFVNPIQFGPNEDFERYPRPLEQDQQRLMEIGCDALFCPAAEEMFPPGRQTVVRVEPLAQDLCGASRPHHFQGVATVVALLLHLIAPDRVFFGWKDYQQVVLLKRMVSELAMPVEVVGVPILREEDGLAMSSRNRYLSVKERQQAVGLYQALQAAQQARQRGMVETWLASQKEQTHEENPLLVAARHKLAAYAINDVEYVALRDAKTLEPLPIEKMQVNFPPPVMLIAARVGATRLIDNKVLSVEPALSEAVPSNGGDA